MYFVRSKIQDSSEQKWIHVYCVDEYFIMSNLIVYKLSGNQKKEYFGILIWLLSKPWETKDLKRYFYD